MSHANRVDVIIIDDSDQEDTSPSASDSSVVLLDCASESRSRSQAAPGPARSGTSGPKSRYVDPGFRTSQSPIREQLINKTALGSRSPDIEMIGETRVGANPGPLATRTRDIIEIDSDERADGPPVRSQIPCICIYPRLMGIRSQNEPGQNGSQRHQQQAQALHMMFQVNTWTM
jgi:hypothetical protein